MSMQGILLYTMRALRFAVPAELIWLLCCLVCGSRKGNLREKLRSRQFLQSSLFVFYLAALLQITVIREGIGFSSFAAAPHDGSTVQLVPLVYTAAQVRAGWWAVLYPVCGNLLWFLPLGVLLPKLWPQQFASSKAVIGAALLLSCSIELLQWSFGSGVSDVDDVIFNAAGAWIGQWMGKAARLR